MTVDAFTLEALVHVDAYIATHPTITRDDVQPGQGTTNRVIFAHRGDEQVVFKVFCEDERKQRETFAMQHWHPTGLVPRLLDDINERMILMSYIPGMYLHTLREREGHATWLKACFQVGAAIAKLSTIPLDDATRHDFGSRFYGKLGPFYLYALKISELAHSIVIRDNDFRDDYWLDSLYFMGSHLPDILKQPKILYHQDVSNLHVTTDGFQGMFDLEMCRTGYPSMQIASAIRMLDGNRDAWQHFKTGWETTTGTALDESAIKAALAGVHLLAWREITRYMSYDGTPGSGYAWASPADPVWYRELLDTVEEMLR